jgi:cell division septum initiation protein DivIVA
MLMSALYVAIIAFLCIQQYNKHVLLQYFSQHHTEIEQRQLTDLQEVHRRRVLALKTEHHNEVRQLQGQIHAANAKVDRAHSEYNWMSDAYQDQMRTVQEQEDRVNYLERKLQEFGQNTATTIQPYSAPSSRIQFDNPPRRLRSRSATGLASPLAQVSIPHRH